MKKIVLILALLFPLAASAEIIEIPHICGPTEEVLKVLKKIDIDEEMIFLGRSTATDGKNLYASLWVNRDTETWTMVLTNKQLETSCILSQGQGLAEFMGESI